MWCGYAMDYYSALKRHEGPTHAKLCVTITVLSEGRKPHTVRFHVSDMSRGGNSIETQRLVVAGGRGPGARGRESGQSLFNGDGVPFWGDGNVWNWMEEAVA